MEAKTDVTQEVMNKAYDRWQKVNCSQRTFWDSLSNRECVAVFVGNMNYQVCNGGWDQWHGNGYSECAPALNKILKAIGPNGQKVAELMRQALPRSKRIEKIMRKSQSRNAEYIAEGIARELEPLDKAYYQINAALLFDLECVVRLNEDDFELWWKLNGLPDRKAKPIAYIPGIPSASYKINFEWVPGVL